MSRLCVSVIIALTINYVCAAFYDCNAEILPLRLDQDALVKLKVAHEEKLKFPSVCLEVLLRKNFFDSANYLMSEYYPNTSIDTEVIIKNVAREIKRS